MAQQGLERIPYAVGPDFRMEPVRARFPEQSESAVSLVPDSFIPDATPEPKPVATEDPGYTGDIWRGIKYGTQVQLPKMAGQALQFFGADGVGKSMVDAAEARATPDMQESAVGQAEKSPYSVRGSVYEAATNAVPSLGPGAAGAAAGAAVGSVVPGVGTALGALAGYALGSVAALPMFYGSQAKESYDAVKANQLQQGKSESEADAIARRTAHAEGTIEAGGELVADVIPFAKLFKPFAKPVGNAIVKSALVPTIKGAAKTVGGVVAAEVPTEMAQQAGQNAVRKSMGGTGPGATWEETQKVIMPTALMSVIPGMAGAGAKHVQQSAALRALVSPDTDPETRSKIALGAAEAIKAGSPEVSKAFAAYAAEQIAARAPIEIADDAFYASAAGPQPIEGTFIPADRSGPPAVAPGAGGYTFTQDREPLQFARPALPAPSPLEGDILGPQALPAGQAMLPPGAIDGAATEAGDYAPAPTLRQQALSRGLLTHSKAPSPDMLKRLMRVDDGMAQRLYDEWAAAQAGPQQKVSPTDGGQDGQGQEAAQEVSAADDDLTIPFPKSLERMTPGNRSLYKVDEIIASLPRLRTNLVISDTPDQRGVAYTPEKAMRQLLAHRDNISDQDGKLRSGNRTGATTGTLLENIKHYHSTANDIRASRQENPQMWADYAARQAEVQKLNVGDAVLAPYGGPEDPFGAPAVIVKKNPKNWRIRYTTGVKSELMVEPAALRPAPKVGAGATAIDAAAHQAATSPLNDLPQPTDAQKKAGNYAKGHVRFHGMDISIENPAGSVRAGKDEDGKAWETTMQHHYGYIKGTVGRDKDHLDVFIKPGAQSARTAYVIDQTNPKTGAFDEHKIILGADSEQDARAIYQSNYQPGWNGLGAITAMPIDEFKAWIDSGKTKKPIAYKEPKGTVKPAAATARSGPESFGKVGPAPGAARAISLQDNGDGTATVMAGDEPFYDFDSGDPVRVPADAKPSAVKQAIIDAGAVTSKDRWFGVNDGETLTKPVPEVDKAKPSEDLAAMFDDVLAEEKDRKNQQPPAATETAGTAGAQQPVQPKKRKAEEGNGIPERIKEFYKPGNIIHVDYWNTFDKVLELQPGNYRGSWNVKVIEVVKTADGQWVPKDARNEPARWHATDPGKDKIVDRVDDAASVEQNAKSETQPALPSTGDTQAKATIAGKPVSEMTEDKLRNIARGLSPTYGEAAVDKAKDELRRRSAVAATHIEGGKREAATPSVVAESIKESAANTPMDIMEARAWLLKEIDQAITDAKSAKEEGIWNRADDKVNLEGVMDVGATIGFKTFNVPGDGKFRVLNLKESLQKFKKQVAASPGFKKNATRPMSLANGSGGKTSVRDMLDDGEYQLAVEYGKLIGKPLLFGITTNGGTPVVYTDASEVEAGGFNLRVGREWTQSGKANGWAVIELSTGLRAAFGETEVKAVRKVENAIEQFGTEGLRDQIGKADKVSQAELERQFTDWGSEEEARAQKQRDALERVDTEDRALWNSIWPLKDGEKRSPNPWNDIDRLQVAILAKDADKAGKGDEFVSLIERRRGGTNNVLALAARKALADAAPKAKPSKGAVTTGVASKILGDIYQRAAYNKWTWDRLKSYLTRELEEAGVGKSRMANALEKAMTEYARTANGRLGYPNSNLVFSAMRDYGLITEDAPDAQQKPGVDYKGFERTPTGNGSFTLKDGNLLVKVEAIGSGKFQASHGSAKSSPHINSEQGAVDWAANLRDASKKTTAYPFYSNNKLYNAEGTAELPKNWTGVARSDSGKRFFYLGQENGERSFNPLKAENYEDALKEADGLKNDKPVVPEGYREVARGYFGGTVERPIYAPFAEGDRVRFIGGHAGNIQSFIGGPVTTGAIIKYDNGLTGRAEWRDVEAAPAASIADESFLAKPEGWDGMDISSREELVARAGWTTKTGAINPQGRQIVKRSWADMPQGTRDTLTRFASGNADRQAEINAIDRHADLMARLREGTATLDEFKAGFADVVDGKAGITEGLSKLTKDAIFERFQGLAYRYKNDKKADIVDAAYRSMLDSFAYVGNDGIQWTHGQKYEDVIRAYVDRTTDESLRKFAADAKAAMESRAAQVSTGTAGRLAITQAKSIVAKFLDVFKRAADLDIRIVASPEEIPARFRPSRYAEGVYHSDIGTIWLVTDNLMRGGKLNASRVFQVLLHEAVGHHGLAAMMGDKFKSLKARVLATAKAKGPVVDDYYKPGDADYATVEAVRLRYPDATDDQVADEVLARMAETDPGRTLFGYVRAVVRQWLRDVARKIGVQLDTTVAELNDLVALASGYMRRGAGMAGDRAPSGVVAASMADSGLESRARPGANQAIWDAPDPTTADNVIYTLQDKHIDLKRVQAAIKEAIGTEIPDQIDPYLQEELFHGRAAKATEEFLDRELQPLIGEMKQRGISMDSLETYLWARHAAERNAQIAKINPDMPDGGSGLTDRQARDVLAGKDVTVGGQTVKGIEPAKLRGHAELARKIDMMVAGNRLLLELYELETPSTLAAWKGAYQHYVPLHREDVDSPWAGQGTGQGYSVRGASTKRATGSYRPVENILANLVMQRKRIITRGEKNRVAQALYGLATTMKNPDFWKVDDVPKIRVPVTPPSIFEVRFHGSLVRELPSYAEAKRFVEYDGNAGLTIHEIKRKERVVEQDDPLFRSRPNVVWARFGGEDRFVIFNERDERAMRLAGALKNLDADDISHFLGEVSRWTRYFASINTQYNPVFGVVNLTRDTGTGLLNLKSTPLEGKQAEMLGHVWQALPAIYRAIRIDREGGTPTGTWAELWEEFQEVGGQTGYRDMFRNATEQRDALEAALDPKWWQRKTWGKVISAGGLLAPAEQALLEKAGKPVLDWLSDYNTTMENAIRLSAYKVARDHGMSRERAASLAKNLTVNFNRKGQAARQLGALYAFFNASVQGTARMLETLKHGRKPGNKLGRAGKQIVYGGLLLGSMQAMWLAAAGFDDDEPPEFVRDRAIIIPLPDKRYLSVPLPLGFHVLPALGRIGTEQVINGFKAPGRAAFHVLDVMADAFNPIGNAGMSMQTLAPTVLDPAAALAENKDWTGKQIYRENFSQLDPKPGHQRTKDTATALSKWLSQALNSLTGGTEFQPGGLSPTPDQIDYLIGQVTGGVGREISKLAQTGGAIATGEELPAYKIPLIGRFYGDAKGQAAVSSRFYENLKAMNMHQAEFMGLAKSDRGDQAKAYLESHPEASMFREADRMQRYVGKLQDEKRKAIADRMPSAKVKEIDAKITEAMQGFNARVAARRMPAVPAQ